MTALPPGAAGLAPPATLRTAIRAIADLRGAFQPAGLQAQGALLAGPVIADVNPAQRRLDLGKRMMSESGTGQDSPALAAGCAEQLRPAAGTTVRCGIVIGQRQLDDLLDLHPPQAFEPITPLGQIVSQTGRPAGGRTVIEIR